jgi:hypothetical protein
VWGLTRRDRAGPMAILLDAWQERYGLPALIERVKKELQYRYGATEQTAQFKPAFGSSLPGEAGAAPELVLIEDKGSGISLRQMLVREKIRCVPYNPGKASKLERLHAVSHIFHAGMVYAMASKYPGRDKNGQEIDKPMEFADQVISQVCSFAGKGSLEHDDLVDSTSQAIRYFADRYGITTSVPKEKGRNDDEGSAQARPVQRLNPYSN